MVRTDSRPGGQNELDQAALPEERLKVERGFRFLKDPVFLSSTLFLKTPRRIMALMAIVPENALANHGPDGHHDPVSAGVCGSAMADPSGLAAQPANLSRPERQTQPAPHGPPGFSVLDRHQRPARLIPHVPE